MFDPFDGRIQSVRDPRIVADYLRKRVDIANNDALVQLFFEEAKKLDRHMEMDGCDLFKFLKGMKPVIDTSSQ